MGIKVIAESVGDRVFTFKEDRAIEEVEKDVYEGEYYVPYITGLKLYVNDELYKDYFLDEKFLSED
ncbi:hypothetical protein S1R3Y_000007 [Vibrio phage vB_ValP_VA-RY-3]|nr:hypothetical protein S1R3Y_000007 [Vibrio phage vB_ValP_VA-RY-3]